MLNEVEQWKSFWRDGEKQREKQQQQQQHLHRDSKFKMLQAFPRVIVLNHYSNFHEVYLHIFQAI